MEIAMKKNGTELCAALTGRLDTTTAPVMEHQVLGQLEGVTHLVLEFKDLKYISSAGLRVLLACQKTINSIQGTMVVRNSNDLLMEIFTATGFLDFLTLEHD